MCSCVYLHMSVYIRICVHMYMSIVVKCVNVLCIEVCDYLDK